MWRTRHRGTGKVRAGAMLLAALTLAGVATAGAPAQAQSRLSPARGLYARDFGPAAAPVGFLEFCDRYPEECRAVGRPSHFVLRLDTTRWNLLQQVNIHVNRKVRPMTDQQIYNRPEVWEYPVNGVGDCEDYVLLKKRYLEALGFPPEALLITVVLDEKGGGHAVLLVRTDRGDLALDNRRNRILPWNRTGYTYLLRQSQRDPGRWVALTRDPIPGPRAYGNN